MVDDMKLTKKQMETVNIFKELEAEHGKGNVFFRWVNDYWKVCFVIHKVGEEIISPLLKDEYKVNGKILNALEEKGLLQCQDINHNKVENPNVAWNNGTKVIGSTIILSE